MLYTAAKLSGPSLSLSLSLSLLISKLKNSFNTIIPHRLSPSACPISEVQRLKVRNSLKNWLRLVNTEKGSPAYLLLRGSLNALTPKGSWVLGHYLALITFTSLQRAPSLWPLVSFNTDSWYKYPLMDQRANSAFRSTSFCIQKEPIAITAPWAPEFYFSLLDAVVLLLYLNTHILLVQWDLPGP